MDDDQMTRGGNFPDTRWSLVLQLKESPTEVRANALEELCRSYWPAIYGFSRYQGHSPSEAEDLTQGLFASILERRGFERIVPDTGRLRTWLIRSFENYRIDQHRRNQSQRRGGGWIAIEITGDRGEELWERLAPAKESPGEEDPERAFDRIWAESVLTAARRAVGEQYRRRDKEEEFNTLEPALHLGDTDSGFTDKAATRLSMTPAAVRKAVQRLRQTYARKIRGEIAQTLANAGDVDLEFKALREALR